MNGNAQSGHDQEAAQTTDQELWLKCPALEALRVELGAHITSFREAVTYERGEKGYPKVVKAITITDGKVACHLRELTDDEATIINAQIAAASWPRSIAALVGHMPDELKDAPEDEIYPFYTQHEHPDHGQGPMRVGMRKENRHGILMYEHRFVSRNGKKVCIPYSYWDDKQWRRCYPDGKRPLFNLHLLNLAGAVLLHEGAKSARAGQEIADGASDERRNHPWHEDMKGAAHLGWIGGATNPQFVDWSPLMKFKGTLIVVADNDHAGKNAVPKISKILKLPMHKIFFDERFGPGFDVADPWPEKAEWWSSEGVYIGPTLRDLMSPATWATDKDKTGLKGAPPHSIRSDFAEEWIAVVRPSVYVNLRQPYLIRPEEEFDNLVRPYSHVERTAKLLRPHEASKVEELAYRPGGAALFTENFARKVNTFMPGTIKPKSAKGEKLKPWLDFLGHLFPVDNDRKEVMRWCATLIACPHIKMEYALLLISEMQGVGKSTLGLILAKLVGLHNAGFPDEHALTQSSFNSGLLSHKRLIVVNELYAGENHGAYDRLKPYITEMLIDVNRKYMDAYTIENWVHIFACSNSMNALRIVEDDRRWLMPRVTEKPQPKEYWRALNAWLNDDGLAYIAWWAHEFLNDKGQSGGSVTRGDTAPMTGYKKEVLVAISSQGKELAREIGEAAMACKDEVVLGVSDVRAAIAAARGITDLNDRRLENPRTILKSLKAVGMFEPEPETGSSDRRRNLGNGKEYVVSNRPVPDDTETSALKNLRKNASLFLQRKEPPM